MHDREKEWRTADGRTVKVKDMELGHLVNIINWILDNPMSYPRRILELMIAEATYRQTFLFAEGKAYPQKMGKVWKLIDPQTGKGHIIPPPSEYIESVKGNVGYQAMAKSTQEKRRQK